MKLMASMHAGIDKALGFFSDQEVRVEITETEHDTRAPEGLDAIPEDNPEFCLLYTSDAADE